MKGSLEDRKTKEEVPFAHISFMNPSDSSRVVNGLSDEYGKFSMRVPSGSYLMEISFVGYNTLYQKVEIADKNTNLGKIRLEPSSESLDEVTVQGAAKLLSSDGEKRTFDVQNTILSEGGTALQVLETLPSLQVDEDGNLSMRGSGDILVYINGRPSNLSGDDAESILEQFPADAIESVELITNPSSRYDAQGVGGIINIILKKSKMQGFNGQVNTSVGTRNKYTAGITTNYRKGNFNLNAGYSYQYRQLFGESETSRENRGTSGFSPLLDQDFYNESYDQNHLLRLQMDYDFHDRLTLGVFANTNLRTRDRDRTYNIRHLSMNRNLDSMYVRDLFEDQNRQNIEGGFTINWEGEKKKDKFMWLSSISYDNRDRTELYDERFFDSQNQEVPENMRDQIYLRPTESTLAILQADYERKLGGSFVLETGLKSTLLRESRQQLFDELNINTGEYEENPLITDDFTYNEHVHAAYIMMKNEWNRWSYQGGVRAELSLTDSYQPKIDCTFVNNYFDFFPSAYVSYKLNEQIDLTTGYSRRINRPNVWRLAPFINAQDLFNLRTGSPYIQPEYTDNYEIAINRSNSRWNITGTVFYRHTTNAMSRIYSLFGDLGLTDPTGTIDDDAAIVSWANANRQENGGVELVNQVNINSRADMTLTTSFFQSRISGVSPENVDFSNETFSWTVNLLSNIKIPNWFSLQIMTNYRGPIVLPQGTIDPIFSFNLGLRREILKNQGTVSLNVSDLFNTQRFIINTETETFDQRRMFNRETQIVTLSFTYRFRDFRDKSEKREGGLNGEDDF